MKAYYDALSAHLDPSTHMQVSFADPLALTRVSGKVSYIWMPPKSGAELAVLWAMWEANSPEGAYSDMVEFAYLPPASVSLQRLREVVASGVEQLENNFRKCFSSFLTDPEVSIDSLSDGFLVALVHSMDAANLEIVMAHHAGAAHLKAICARSWSFSAPDRATVSARFVEVLQNSFLHMVLCRGRFLDQENGLEVLESLLTSALDGAVRLLRQCVRCFWVRIALDGSTRARRFSRLVNAKEKKDADDN
jgi:hypothetical protein